MRTFSIAMGLDQASSQDSSGVSAEEAPSDALPQDSAGVHRLRIRPRHHRTGWPRHGGPIDGIHGSATTEAVDLPAPPPWRKSSVPSERGSVPVADDPNTY